MPARVWGAEAMERKAAHDRKREVFMDRKKAEGRFRYIAFQIAYHRIYEGVHDRLERFRRSIVYSAQDIRDESLFVAWWEWTHGMEIKRAIKLAAPPECLRALVEAWQIAVADRDADEATAENFRTVRVHMN